MDPLKNNEIERYKYFCCRLMQFLKWVKFDESEMKKWLSEEHLKEIEENYEKVQIELNKGSFE